MEIEDKIYGREFLEEAVLQEVACSKPMERLQGLRQCGVSFYRWPHLDVTRYEHSLGVMALLQSWDASVEEQLAGMLHDINHLAFSHVADILFGDENQEFAEQFQRKMIMESEIPEILGRYGIDPELMINFKQFPLLEQDLPDLCADRFDYGLRDCVSSGSLSLEEAHTILDDVHIINSSVISFRTLETAKLFAIKFREENAKHWTNPLDMAMYRIFSDALRIALEKKVLTMDDFFLTDEEVWEKLKICGLPEVEVVVEKIPHLEITVVEQGQPFDFHLKSKIRLIDPLVMVGEGEEDEVQRLSELDSDFAVDNAEFLNKYQEGFFVKID